MKKWISLSAASLFAAAVLLSQTSEKAICPSKSLICNLAMPPPVGNGEPGSMWHTANTPSDWN